MADLARKDISPDGYKTTPEGDWMCESCGALVANCNLHNPVCPGWRLPPSLVSTRDSDIAATSGIPSCWCGRPAQFIAGSSWTCHDHNRIESQPLSDDVLLDNLVDINEVAERFGIPARTVQTWRYRSSVGQMDPPTPDEVKTVAQGVPLFWWWDWLAWADESGRTIPLHPKEAA